MMDDPYAKYRDEIRAKGMMATPFRLGIAVGHAGDDLPSPYPKGNRGDQLYREGLELGRLRRAKEAGRAAAPEPPAQEPGTAAEIEALRAEVERLNRILGRIVEGDGDSTLVIHVGTDAFAAAREYLRPNT